MSWYRDRWLQFNSVVFKVNVPKLKNPKFVPIQILAFLGLWKKKDPKDVCEGVTCSQPSLELLDLHGDYGEVVQDSSFYCFRSA